MCKRKFSLFRYPQTAIKASIVLCRFMSFPAVGLLGSEEHAFSSLSLAEVHSLREKAVREDIARRLGHICSDFSPDEFDKLVSMMAERQVKCERRATW
jgi:hypothetical protein